MCQRYLYQAPYCPRCRIICESQECEEMICCEQAIEKGELCAETDITTNYYGARITRFKYDCPKCRHDSRDNVESGPHCTPSDADHAAMAEHSEEQVPSDDHQQHAEKTTHEPTAQETNVSETAADPAHTTQSSQSCINTEAVYDLSPQPTSLPHSSFIRRFLSKFKSSSKQPNPQQVHSCRSKTYNLEWSHNRPFLIEKCTCTSKPYNNIFELIASKFDDETERYTLKWETGATAFDLSTWPIEEPSGK